LERLEEWEVSSEAPLIASHALPCCEILPPDF